MFRRGAVAALAPVAHEDDPNALMTERFERRLGEECGKLRVEMVDGFGKLRAELCELRAGMISRNADLMKWLLVFFVTQIAAIAALLKLFR